jgi:hypothetical protein
MDERILVAYLHNGFSMQVQGNERSIDVLKQLIVPNTLVKGIAIYTAEPVPTERSKVEQLNYTALKALRE